MRKDYEFIEHTADIGVRVKGRGLKDLFKNAALAMFDIIAEEAQEKKPQRRERFTIKQRAEGVEELFVDWLSELLSLSAAKELIFNDFKIEKLDKNNLVAKAQGSDAKYYRMNTEIKAVTYHELKIERTESGWQAQVIFDV